MTSISKIDFLEITKSFVKLARGPQSQTSLSEELNNQFNIVSRWETGVRQFYWDDFVLLYQYKGWNVSVALEEVTHFKFSNPSTSQEIVKCFVSSSESYLLEHFSVQKLNL